MKIGIIKQTGQTARIAYIFNVTSNGRETIDVTYVEAITEERSKSGRAWRQVSRWVSWDRTMGQKPPLPDEVKADALEKARASLVVCEC